MTMIGMNEVSVVRAMPRWGKRQKDKKKVPVLLTQIASKDFSTDLNSFRLLDLDSDA